MTTKLTLITGPSGSGKSIWCFKLAEQARGEGMTVGGLLSLSVMVEGRKVRIDLLDLISGESRQLAFPQTMTSRKSVTPCWQFNPETLAWANKVIRDLPPCDMVIIDEMGPLEFILGEGLEEGLRLIDTQQVPQVYVVVRPELLSQALDRWPWAGVVNLTEGSVTAGAEGEKYR